jgi:hypothetical protein
MGNLQETLNSLQPYVNSISYVSNKQVVVAKFNNGWILPDSKLVTKVKSAEDSDSYFIYSEVEGIGLDEILDYIRVVINVNLEREKKHLLLKEKIEELKTLFKKNTLAQLTKLRFVLTDDLIMPKSEDIELHDIDIEPEAPVAPAVQLPPPTSVVEVEPEYIPEPQIPLPDNMTEEELEILEEERRAENYRLYREKNPQPVKQPKGVTKKHQRVELPPRQMAYVGGCDCGENEACEKCIDAKGY